MYIEIAKLVLDVLKEIRDLIGRSDKPKTDLVSLGTLLQLYGSATKLDGYLDGLRRLLHKEAEQESVRELIGYFITEVYRFGRNLEDVSLHVIGIYYPDLESDLFLIIHSDAAILASFFETGIAQKYNIKDRKVKKVLDFYVQKLLGRSSDYGCATTDLEHQLKMFYRRPEEAAAFLDVLYMTLRECRRSIEAIIRENWDFKELVSLS